MKISTLVKPVLITSLLVLVACNQPPVINHDDRIDASATIPFEQGDVPRGTVCFDMQYEASGFTLANANQPSQLYNGNHCQQATVQNDQMSFSINFNANVPFHTIKIMKIDNVRFVTRQSVSDMDGYEIQKTYPGRLVDYTKPAEAVHTVKLEFSSPKKAPIGSVEQITAGCTNSNLNSNDVQYCIKWRLPESIAHNCSKYDQPQEFECLRQAAIQLGTYNN